MSLVPLPERRGINLNDGALDEGVRADKLVVRRIVHLYETSATRPCWICANTHDTDDPRPPRYMLAGPGKVT
jgi:hypothetical protein